MPLYVQTSGGGGTTTDAVARTQSAAAASAATANAADIATLEAADTAQDSLIALNATKAEVALIKADNDAQDPFTSFVRQADNSIDWTKESGATGTIAAPTVAASVDLATDAEFAAGTEETKPPTVKQVVDAEALKADKTELSTAAQRAAWTAKQDAITLLTSIRADGVATDTGFVSEKAVRDALEALNFAGVYKGSAATVAALPAGVNGDWAILTADDGANVAGIYVTDGTTYSLAKTIPDFAALTTAQITSTTGADYTATGLVSTARLDEWGQSRRVQRIFNVSTAFDFNALNYADKTAVYVRNQNTASGINIIYGTGGTNTLEITHASGQTNTITGQDQQNVQPGEIVFMEKEGTTVRMSIIPGERVTVREDYATANAGGPYPHDGIVLIRSTGELFFRKTTVNNVAFPADGQENADWWKIGQSEQRKGATRTVDSNGTLSMNSFDLENGTDGNIFEIPLGFAPSFRWSGVVDVAFQLNNYAGSLVSATETGAHQEIMVTGPATLVHTKDGNLHKVTVKQANPAGGDPFEYWQISANAAVVADETIAIDYSAQSKQFLESRIISIGTNTITFDPPTFGAGEFNKIRRHRVWINSNTATTTVSFAASGWRLEGDANVTPPDITIEQDKNITLEFNYTPQGGIGYVRQIGSGDKATATYQGLQVIHQWTGSEDASNERTIDFGADLTGAEWALIWWDDPGSTGYTQPYVVSMIEGQDPGLVDMYGTAHADIDQINLSAGTMRFRTVGAGWIFKAIFYGNAENGYVVPTGTTITTPRTISLTGGLGTINGASTGQAFEGLPVTLKLDLNPGQQISTASIDAGIVEIVDPVAGTVLVTASTADATITITETVAATYTGLQLVARKTYGLDNPLVLSGAFQTVDLSEDISGCMVQVDFRHVNDSHCSTASFYVDSVALATDTGALLHWYDTGYIRVRIDNAAAVTAGLIRLLHINTSFEIVEIRAYKDAANGYVIPTATTSKTQINLTVNGGANVVAPTRLLEGAGAAAIIVELPAGQMIDATAFEAQALPAGVTAVVRDAEAGTIAIEVADGTGNVDLTVPFGTAPDGAISTTEVDTGHQWNGKTVYRRQIANPHTANSATVILAGVDQVLSFLGVCNVNGTAKVAPTFHDGSQTTRWWVNGGDLTLGFQNFVSVQSYDVVVEYTKV